MSDKARSRLIGSARITKICRSMKLIEKMATRMDIVTRLTRHGLRSRVRFKAIVRCQWWTLDNFDDAHFIRSGAGAFTASAILRAAGREDIVLA